MNKIRWFAYIIPNTLFVLVAYIMAPLIALFVNKDGWLPLYLAWFQTQDSLLEQTIYGIGWWARVRWQWRNPGYGFSYWVLGLPWKKEEWTITSVVPFKASGPSGAFAFHGKKWKFGWKAWWFTDIDKFTDGYEPIYPYGSKEIRVPFTCGQ